MTRDEAEILMREKSRDTIERNIADDPARLALRLTQHGALLATQLKYLQRSRTKLPSYYEARCILPPLAFEQSSSEETAAAKTWGGELCIDLTCGLGVDSLYLSKRFRRVIALERDPALAFIARANFERLGAGNIEVVNTTAEEFVAGFRGKADLIYADPARRGEGNRKLLLLEECSPDMLSLLPCLKQISARIAIKASPLFDAGEAFRLFGDGIIAEAVSARGECKELVIEIPSRPDSSPGGILRATMAGTGTLSFSRAQLEAPLAEHPFAPPYGYLLVPDVSLYKIRAARHYLASVGACAPSLSGYGFSDTCPPDFFGHGYRISQIMPYRPKELKTLLKKQDIGRLNILKKDFADDAETIARALGVRQGGNAYAAFTTIGRDRYAVLLENRR